MFDKTVYEKTERILKDFTYCENGVDFKKSLTIDVAYCVVLKRGKEYPLYRYIVCFLFPLIEKGFLFALNKYDTLFSIMVKREDYNRQLSSIVKSIPNAGFIQMLDVFKRRLIIPGPCFWRVLRASLKCDTSFRNKLFISKCLYDYVIAVRSLNKHVLRNSLVTHRKYVPSNSSAGLENAITQYLNTRDCVTFHFCHGLHFAPNYKYFTVDAYNKEIIAAQIVLSWAQSFIDNDQKYFHHHYKHEIVGNPNYPDKQFSIKFSKDSCVVLLARRQYDPNNVKLLDLLSTLHSEDGVKIFVKPHPTDDKKMLSAICEKYGFDFIDDGRTIAEIFSNEKFGFAISYETTSYFEALYFDMICFRFALNENESYGDFDDRFVTIEDLRQQIDKMSRQDMNSLSEKVHDFLVYEMGIGINNYAEVINRH